MSSRTRRLVLTHTFASIHLPRFHSSALSLDVDCYCYADTVDWVRTAAPARVNARALPVEDAS